MSRIVHPYKVSNVKIWWSYEALSADRSRRNPRCKFPHQVECKTCYIAPNYPECSYQSALSLRYLVLLFFFILCLSHLLSRTHFQFHWCLLKSAINLKNTHNQGWDSTLLWVSDFIKQLRRIKASFIIWMYRITIGKEKLNMYAVTGWVDKNTGYSSITAHEKIKQYKKQQGHFNV